MKQYDYHLLDFDVFRDLSILKSKRNIIWGAAEKGRQIKNTLEQIGITTEAFCDSDLNKWGQSYDGIPIISPYKLKASSNQSRPFQIISCVFREKDILRLLQELGLSQVPFLSYWGIKTVCILYGIPFVPEGTLTSYDKIWNYQMMKNKLKEQSLIRYLKKLQTRNSDTIWCLQPGKVGSLTVEARLQRAGFQTIQGHDFLYLSMYGDSALKDFLAKMLPYQISKGIKIVTGVREPLARDYSAFWEPFTRDLPYIMPILNKDFQRMYENYIELLSKGYEYTRLYLKESMPFVWRDEFQWFHEEIKKHVGIDIYQHPFDKEKGYQIIRQGNIQIFIYKTEKLDNVMPMLSKFLGKNICSDGDSNRAENKSYHLAYKEFRENIKLPHSYVEHYYKKNPYMDHFYTKEEQSLYLSKWKDYIDE